VAWTTLIDDVTRSRMPPSIREMPVLEFYRHIGCDVLQFGHYGLPEADCVVPPCRFVSPQVETSSHSDPDGTWWVERRTDWGPLTASFKNGHPVKYPVESVEDLRILKNVWLHSHYEATPGAEESYQRAEAALGESGIYAETVAPSPVQQLIELEMGLCRFYYLLEDHRREMEELLEIMHARRLEEYEILARRSQAEVIIPVENTSSSLTSPAIYARYSLPQIRDYVRVIHRHGKLAVLHMCGHLKALLEEIRRTELDGINGLTPPPVGDTRYEDVLDAFGEDFLILGGVFPPEIFHQTDLTYPQFSAALESLFTPRLRRARFLLWIGVDGLPTDLERFEMVQRWVEKRGAQNDYH